MDKQAYNDGFVRRLAAAGLSEAEIKRAQAALPVTQQKPVTDAVPATKPVQGLQQPNVGKPAQPPKPAAAPKPTTQAPAAAPYIPKATGISWYDTQARQQAAAGKTQAQIPTLQQAVMLGRNYDDLSSNYTPEQMKYVNARQQAAQQHAQNDPGFLARWGENIAGSWNGAGDNNADYFKWDPSQGLGANLWRNIRGAGSFAGDTTAALGRALTPYGTLEAAFGKSPFDFQSQENQMARRAGVNLPGTSGAAPVQSPAGQPMSQDDPRYWLAQAQKQMDINKQRHDDYAQKTQDWLEARHAPALNYANRI